MPLDIKAVSTSSTLALSYGNSLTSYKSGKSLKTNLSGNCPSHEQLTVITPYLSPFTCLNQQHATYLQIS